MAEPSCSSSLEVGHVVRLLVRFLLWRPVKSLCEFADCGTTMAPNSGGGLAFAGGVTVVFIQDVRQKDHSLFREGSCQRGNEVFNLKFVDPAGVKVRCSK